MRKILEELYHGNLSVDERTIRAGSKYACALAEVAKIEEALYEKVPEKDHALLRDYALASAQLANVSMVEDFTTGKAIPSPYVAMSQSFSKQANNLWYQIYQVVRENCSVEYKGATPHDDMMERLLTARRGG